MKAWRYSSAWVAAAGLALGAGGGSAALASAGDEERVYRQDALAHAAAVASAYRRLEQHILLDSTAVTSWSGSVPPGTMGWLDVWTERGVRARYCGDTLLVYLDPPSGRLKGIGEDHRSVHVAPFAYLGDGNEGQFATLHWLEGGVAEGGEWRPDVPLPACMTGDPLPSGRAALAGTIEDPFASGNLVDRETHELRTVPCPPGMHGPGRRESRQIEEQETGRGDPVAGTRVEGTWQLVADACRADYEGWERYTVACSWNTGAPEYRDMFGEEIWRRWKSVTASGTTYGRTEFVSTSCWEKGPGERHTPEISERNNQQSMSVACGQGYTGSYRYTRIETVRSTRFPWDERPVVTRRYTSWRLASSSCVKNEDPVKPPDCGPDKEDCSGKLACDRLKEDCGGGEGRAEERKPEPGKRTVDVDKTRERSCPAPMTGTYVETQTVRYEYELYEDGTRSTPVVIGTGAWWMSQDDCVPPPDVPGHAWQPPGGVAPGSPGSGVCGPPGDGSASPGEGDCTGVDASVAAAVAAATGNGDGGDGGGGCYFTTAVVELRGDEPDDGPTLTALRDFRDTYMMETPLRRAMVWAYYRIAPLVVRDLPADDPSWQPMGEHIDRSVALIREGNVEAAFRAYVTGSSRLMLRWWLLRAGRAFS